MGNHHVRTHAFRLTLVLAVLLVFTGAAAADEAERIPLYFTSFEYDVPFVGGPEWQLPPRHPWAQNSNDPMFRRTVGDDDPNLFNPVRTRTGVRSIYQHETFSQWSAMKDFGIDLYDDFYVKAWVWFERERERLTNVQAPCVDITDHHIHSGIVTDADDGGYPIPGWPACRITKPSITDSTTYFHMQADPVAYIVMTSGDAEGLEWTIERPTFYTCDGPPFGTNPYWNINQRLQVIPKAPNTLNPVEAGVKAGDSYTIRGSIAPLYRAVQMWVENRDADDFAKFGIWRRYGGQATQAVGAQCEDTNNWKYITRQGDGQVYEYYHNPWIDTGIHRGYDFTGWHSLEVRVYGDNQDPDKNQKIHFLVDDTVMAIGDRYTAGGPVPFNRLQIGGLAVSQEWAFWDDIEIGLLPEGGEVVETQSIVDARSMPDGTWVQLPPAVVTTVGNGWFQIQGPQWASGLRCIYDHPPVSGNARLRPGDVIIPTGRLATINGCERVLYAINPALIQRDAQTDNPIWANHRSLRSDSPSMQGLKVATFGKVVDPGDFFTHFYLDDRGDPNQPQGIKIYANNMPFVGVEYITVKGVLGCEDGNPVIYVQDPETDIEIVEFWVD